MASIGFDFIETKSQGSYMSGRVKFKDFSRTFKAVYQQIQGLNTEEGVRNQQNMTLNCSKRNFIMRSDMNMQNQFNKMSVLNVKQFQKISKN
jgi:hypothetical protein